MEVVAASPSSASGTTPFQRRDVEEWSHLDTITGMLEHARVETDHWAANSGRAQRQYGKVVDSRDRLSGDGNAAQRQRRQLEVFQARVPGGSLQVIRTQSHTTSTKRWSNTSTSSGPTTNSIVSPEFENLQLALNPLDLSSQKTKASVGRSGSIGGRRPPSRPRSIASDIDVATRLQKVSRLCQQLHEEAIVKPTTQHEDLMKRSPIDRPFLNEAKEDSVCERINKNISSKFAIGDKPSIFERQNGDGSESLISGKIEDWRTSKIKSSDTDTDRRLNTVLRGNNVDLEALDQILKSISSSTTSSSTSDDLLKSNEQPEKDDSLVSSSRLNKRQSFITVESLQEVRGRLRRLSSPVDEFNYKPIEQSKEEEPDDGIVAEDTSMMKKEEIPTMPASNIGVSRVRSYVYGMEALLHNNKKPIIGTGSLESRTSNKSNGSSIHRSEDWYNRRKSYGFEQVHNQQLDQTNSISLRGKNKIESSTDSGICRSTEIVVIPSVFKSQLTNEDNISKYITQPKVTTSFTKVGNSTVINLSGGNKNTNSVAVGNENNKQENELFSIWNRRAKNNNQNDNKAVKNDTEQITITIPIISDDSLSNNRRMYHRQISDGTSVSIESPWNNQNQKSQDIHEIKRHSIAVDESKYISRSNDNKYSFPQIRLSTLVVDSTKPEELSVNDMQDEEGINNFGKKQKKVEFCKTEVHFAAESGRVNIVETDEKPPPTQNFRRRRRNSSLTNNHVLEDFNKNGLPLIHFGDTTYEKKLFGVSDSEDLSQNDNPETFNKDIKSFPNGSSQDNVVTVSAIAITNNNNNNNMNKENEQDIQENDNQPRGILKNKMIKPRPYLLGDDNNEIMSQTTDDQENTIWGVRLRPVHKEESPQIWRSTVTVQNTYNLENDNQKYEPEPSKPEFQKLLHSLRPSRKSEPSLTSPGSTPDKKTGPSLDLRRSSWSVADRVKQVEDMKFTENKGYSTRVNFGGGEATVVENGDLVKNDQLPTWPRLEETHSKDNKKQSSSVINKGLVVRIGREDSNHTVCSKTTTNHNSNSTTTTTKITIDMSPSPTSNSIDRFHVPIKLPRASLHSLKSTSLIMNTFPKPDPIQNTVINDITHRCLPEAVPDQLAALKKLYDDAAEHSDDSERADEEVRSYMSGGGDESDVKDTDQDVSSVVSGSWSKMKAFRNIKQHLNNIHGDSSRQKESEMFRKIINRNTFTKRDFPIVYQQKKSVEPLKTSRYDKQTSAEAKVTSVSLRCNKLEKKSSHNTNSPQLDRKHINNSKKSFDVVRTPYNNANLSSPSLVGNSIHCKRQESVIQQSKLEDSKLCSEKTEQKVSTVGNKNSPSLRRKQFSRKIINSQPTYTKRNDSFTKKSEPSNNYYSEIQSPKPTKKLQKQLIANKPDLLQHHDTREYVNLSSVIIEDNENTVTSISTSNKSRTADIRKVSSRKQKSVDRPESPIYENIDEVINDLTAMEKESSMLQELTKAADQILQAVNGYTDEDSNKLTTDSEEESKKHRLNLKKTSENLSTISETKSWKVQSMKNVSRSVKNPRKVRSTSSTSSIESISKEVQKPVPPVRLNRATKLNDAKKKITGNNSELSKATRARRLQRASSREALLQSHGSSSEDISNSMEVIRKPRLVRRSKTQQSSPTEEGNSSSKKSSLSQSSVTRRRECDIRRNVDRIPVVGLQEIRHKTAVSTIRSTAEKAASREKALKAREDLKRKISTKKDTTGTKGSNFLSSSATTRLSNSGSHHQRESAPMTTVRSSSGVYVLGPGFEAGAGYRTSGSPCPCLCS